MFYIGGFWCERVPFVRMEDISWDIPFRVGSGNCEEIE